MTKRRNRPSSPEEIRQAMRQKAIREEEITRLTAQGVHVVAAPNKEIIRAVRLDCFAMLLQQGALSITAFDAFRRLEEVNATATGALKNEQGYDRVDTTSLGQNITQAQVDASKLRDRVLVISGVRTGRLLRALLEPQVALLTRWRETVSRITGEKDTRVLTACVRQACECLAVAWREVDYGRAA